MKRRKNVTRFRWALLEQADVMGFRPQRIVFKLRAGQNPDPYHNWRLVGVFETRDEAVVMRILME